MLHNNALDPILAKQRMEELQQAQSGGGVVHGHGSSSSSPFALDGSSMEMGFGRTSVGPAALELVHHPKPKPKAKKGEGEGCCRHGVGLCGVRAGARGVGCWPHRQGLAAWDVVHMRKLLAEGVHAIHSWVP